MESAETQNSVPNDGDRTEETASPPPRPRSRWLLPLIGILLIGGGGFVAWRLLAPGGNPPAATANQPQGVRVRVAPVETATVADSSEYIANLDSRQSVNLLPQVEGRVAQIFVEPGQEVAAGTRLIGIDPDEQQAAVNSQQAAAQASRAEVESTQATLRQIEAQRIESQSQLNLAKQRLERYSQLAQQGAVSADTRDQYENDYKAAVSGLGAIDKQLEAQKSTISQRQRAAQQQEANVKELQTRLAYYTINAPFAGTVGDIPVKEGDFVNTSTQLSRLTQNRPLEVEVSVPIEQGSRLRSGMPIELLDAAGNSVGTSRIFFIAPSTANTTQSVLVKSLFENEKGQLRADQYVRARVIWNQREGAVVPATAVTRLGGETFVFVAEEAPPPPPEQQAAKQQPPTNKPALVAKQKPVKLGTIQGNNYQVLEGLEPGERIIVSGLLQLKDGAPIVPES